MAPHIYSAGVGRTGTLIAIDCVLDQLQEEKVVDIAGVIIHLRTQRMKMVQSSVRYKLREDTYVSVTDAAGPVHLHP